jgi:hypothetical protein
MTRTFKFTHTTSLKPDTRQSTSIPESEVFFANAGDTIKVDDFIGEKDGHFVIKPTFYVYKQHVQEQGRDKHPNDKNTNIQRILKECKKQGCLQNQAAYILATVEHETGGLFLPVREAYWLSEEWRRKNLRYYEFYGRGFPQLTWKANYLKYEKIMGIPLVAEPDRAMNPDVSAFILVHGMMNGNFGVALPVYVNAQKTDYYNARRSVNILDKAEKIARLATKWYGQLTKEGY